MQEDQMSQLVKEIAQYLPGWTQRTKTEFSVWENLQHESGASITFYAPSYKKGNKIEVSPNYVYGVTHNPPQNRVNAIKVSSNREPQKLAKDILNRLITPYLPTYEEGKKRNQEYQDYDKARKQVALEIATMLGTHPSMNGYEIVHYGDKHAFTARVDTPESIQLTIGSLTPEQVKEIMVMVKG